MELVKMLMDELISIAKRRKNKPSTLACVGLERKRHSVL